jgi:two-component system response regulator DctR
MTRIAKPSATGVVYVVDDEEVVRDALCWLFRSRHLLPEPFVSADALWASVEAGTVPGGGPACLLLDVRMPGMNGMALFDRLVERRLVERLPVIFLTGHADVATAVSAVKRGAFDFVEKPFSDNALVDRAVQALAHSEAELDRQRSHAALHARLTDLTEREREVMRLILEGRPNKLIADALNISVRTVEVHRARVFDKMSVKSAVELANLLQHQPPAGGTAP